MKKRTSRRKRTSRQNPRARSTVARAKKIARLESRITNDLHRLRMAWKDGPVLSIPEERALDSIAIDVARTRDYIGQTMMKSGNAHQRVAKALGYHNY